MKVVNNKYAFATLLVLGFAFVVSNVFAQQKDLKIEDDDFRWYLLRQNGYEGAELYDGTTIIPLSREYTWIVYYTTSDGWFGVKKNMKEGACDKEGKEIVPPKYDDVHYYKADGFEYYTIKLKGKAGVLDKEGRELLAPKKYDYVSYKNAEGFDHFLVGKNNRMGLCDMNGNEIIKPKYDMYSVYYDTDDGYIHVRLDGKCGAFDKEGKQLVPPQYNYLQYSSNDSFEYMDDTGHLVSLGVSLMSGNSIQVDAQGRKLHTQSNGYKWYEVESDGSVGVLSTKGDTIVPLTKAYDSVYYQKNNGGWFIVKKNGKVGVYNKMGREILSPAKYDYVKSEKHPNFLCFKVKQDGRWGVCDSNGKEIIKPTYDNVQYEDNNFFMVESDKKWGVIDINGNVIISPKYQSVDYRYKRYFEVGQDGLKGVCDKNGREVVPPQFKVIKYQSDLFWYKNDAGTWIPLEITLDGNVTFMHEKDGFRWRKVEKDSLCAAQDMNGSFLISFGKEYDGIWYNENKGGWFSVTKNGKMGACQKDGCERISPYTYDIVYYCNDGGHEYYVVGIGNAYGICN